MLALCQHVGNTGLNRSELLSRDTCVSQSDQLEKHQVVRAGFGQGYKFPRTPVFQDTHLRLKRTPPCGMILLVPFQVHFSACLECLDMGVGLPPTHISQSEPSKYSKVRAPEGSRARSGLWMTRESFFSFSKSRLF